MAGVVMKRFPSAPGTSWRENQSVRTRAQELRKPRRHRPPLRWENETSPGNPESSYEAIAVRDAVHGQSRAPEAEFRHIRLCSRRPDPVRRRYCRKEPQHFPRHRLERLHGWREDRPSQGGSARPSQAASSDRSDLDRLILGYRDSPTAHVASRQLPRDCGGGEGHLPQIFQEQAAQMAGTLVANPELKVSIMPGSELADAYTVRPVLNRLPRPRLEGGSFTVPLRDLIAGEQQTLVFRMGVPARPAGRANLVRFSLVEVVQDVELNFTDDPRLSGVETNAYPRTLLSSAEATVLMQRAVQTREATAMQKAETIMKTLASDAGAAAAVRANPALNEVMTTMRDAQATVARSGLQLSDSAKKDFLQATTIIGKKKPRK